MMGPNDWSRIRHFGPDEAWGDPSRMVFRFVYLLDSLRDYLAKSMVISKGTQGTHVETSLHYLGRAADVVFPGLTIADALNLFIAASRFPFTEIGLYVGWEYQSKPIAGMHLGYRDPNPNEAVSPTHYWIGTDKVGADGTPDRLPLTVENMHTQGFLPPCPRPPPF